MRSIRCNKAPYGRTRRGDIGGPVHRPHMNGNYLNIKHKKCKFLYDAQSALRADSKRGYRWPGPRPHMNGNYLNIKHKKCKFLYDAHIGFRRPGRRSWRTDLLAGGVTSLRDAFWDNTSQAFLSGLISYLATSVFKQEKRQSTLRAMFGGDDLPWAIAKLLDGKKVLSEDARQEFSYSYSTQSAKPGQAFSPPHRNISGCSAPPPSGAQPIPLPLICKT